MTPLDILKFGRAVIVDGGDPDPCEEGQYCIRCCLAIAKGEIQDANGDDTSDELSNAFEMLMGMPMIASAADQVLIEVCRMVKAFEKEYPHFYSKEEALTVIDRAIEGVKK